MIIKSLLDTDLYKLTMQQFAFHFLPNENKHAIYSLKCRSNIDLLKIKDKIEKEISNFKQLKFKQEELDYLKTLGFFKDDYLQFLKTFNFDNCIIQLTEKNKQLSIRISGPWHYSILFETPCLAIIQEIYFQNQYDDKELLNVIQNGKDKLFAKIELIKKSTLKISDFGTRRRFSFDWQNYVVSTLKESIPHNLIGTSNVLLAKNLNIKPIGTMAHEFFSAMQGLDFIPIELSQKYALHMWNKEYQGTLDIALTDIFNIDSFLHDCDFDLLNKYSGFRHDSGSPINWGNRIINHLINYGINPKEKTLVFSDGLDIPTCLDLNQKFSPLINTVFGIGTNLTNDFDSHNPISLVMKLVNFNNKPVIKVSDEPAKITCEDDSLKNYILKYLKTLKEKEHTYPIINTSVDIVLEKNNSVLMLKRGQSNEVEFNKLAFAGGFIEINETAIQSAVRELKEETGLNLTTSELSFIQYKDDINRDPRKRNITLVFKAKIDNSHLNQLKETEEASQFVWINQDNINNYEFAFDHKKILEDFFKGKSHE